MSNASASPDTIRLRATKFCLKLGVPSGYSDMITPPDVIIVRASCVFDAGNILSRPFASTAMCIPPARTAALWAAASTPRARPLTIVTPFEAKSHAKSSVTRLPYGVIERDPTIATRGCSSHLIGAAPM